MKTAIRGLALAGLLVVAATAGHAACTPITSLALVAGGPPVHVSITDQACNIINPSPLPNPTNLVWINLVNANGFFTITADSTGFNFAGLQPLSSGSATPRFTSGTTTLTGSPITIIISTSITAIQTIQQ
jgi:hypothetical protein